MEPLRDIKAAAGILGISPHTLAKQVTARTIPFRFIGRHVRFTEEDLAAIVEAGKRTPETVPSRTEVTAIRAAARRRTSI